MLIIMIHTSACLIITLALLSLMKLYSRKINTRSKESPFECGFDPHESARLPFSMRFFLLAIIFLIFDIEVAMLFPVIISMKMMMFKTSYLASGVFLIILMTGLIHEWKQGTLMWVK